MTRLQNTIAMGGKVRLFQSFQGKFSTLLLVAGVLPMVVAAPAWAAGGGGNPWMDFLYKSINAVIFFSIIFFLARKPVKAFFRNAASESRQSFLDSRTDSDRIAEELAAQQNKLNELEKELKWMVEEAKEAAETDRKWLEGQAAAQAERIKLHYQQQLQQEMHKARRELKEQLANKTVELAEKLILARVDGKKQEVLVDEFTKQVEAN